MGPDNAYNIIIKIIKKNYRVRIQTRNILIDGMLNCYFSKKKLKLIEIVEFNNKLGLRLNLLYM
jgi:hypothetical protein